MWQRRTRPHYLAIMYSPSLFRQRIEIYSALQRVRLWLWTCFRLLCCYTSMSSLVQRNVLLEWNCTLSAIHRTLLVANFRKIIVLHRAVLSRHLVIFIVRYCQVSSIVFMRIMSQWVEWRRGSCLARRPVQTRDDVRDCPRCNVGHDRYFLERLKRRCIACDE